MAKDDVYIISDENLGSPFGINGSEQESKGERKGRRARSSGDPYAGSGDGRPRTAASLSMWICGTGQLLHGEWKIGSLYLLVLGFVFSFHYFLQQGWSHMTSWAGAIRLSEFDLLVGVILMDLYLAVVLLSGIYNAYRIGKAHADVDEVPSPHPLLAVKETPAGEDRLRMGFPSRAQRFLRLRIPGPPLLNRGIAWGIGRPIFPDRGPGSRSRDFHPEISGVSR